MDRVDWQAAVEVRRRPVMLRILTVEEPYSTTLKLEGRLVSDWIPEAHRAWSEVIRKLNGKKLTIDLFELTFADDLGRELLSLMHEAGARLLGTGPMISGLIEEIQSERRQPKGEFLKMILFLI
jgi:hypothetical protein